MWSLARRTRYKTSFVYSFYPYIVAPSARWAVIDVFGYGDTDAVFGYRHHLIVFVRNILYILILNEH